MQNSAQKESAGEGWLFILDESEARRIHACKNDDDLMVAVRDVQEFCYCSCYIGNQWLDIHHCLTQTLKPDTDDDPLKLALLGGEALHQSADRIVCYKSPEQVKAILQAIKIVDENWFCDRYLSTVAKDDFANADDELTRDEIKDDGVFLYENFEWMLDPYEFAAEKEAAVLFVVNTQDEAFTTPKRAIQMWDAAMKAHNLEAVLEAMNFTMAAHTEANLSGSPLL